MVAGVVILTCWPCSGSWAKDAGWIWSPQHTKNAVPEGACYFRKTFTAQAPIRVQATIAADDEYELFVNGQKVRHRRVVSGVGRVQHHAADQGGSEHDCGQGDEPARRDGGAGRARLCA